MAYRQPRTPEYRDGEHAAKNTIRDLILFLKDFSVEAWAANGRRKKEIEALDKRIRALEERDA